MSGTVRGPALDLRIVAEAELRQAIGMAEAIEAARAAFLATARGQVRSPAVVGVELPEAHGEFHIKAAHLEGSPYFVVKVASGFYGNPERGLPSGAGLMLAFDAATGRPAALLLDNAFLTDLRTGAAGGLAAEYLAPPTLSKVAVIGAGVQARHQLRALAVVRRLPRVEVWGRTAAHAEACAAEMRKELDADVCTAVTAEAAVRGANVVITVTPSRQPLVRGEWLAPGCHLTAVGSDAAEKRELDGEVFARADVIVADRLDQCRGLGEIHHALDDGVLTEAAIRGELGDLVAGRIRGRTSDEEITVCDLTGLGAQDAAIASLALSKV